MAAADPFLVAAAVLVLAAVLASTVSARLGVPAVLLFILIGMLAGSEGIGGIEFDDYELAQGVGIVALAYILFSGGFDTRWGDIRPVLGKGLALATVGVAVTALVVGAVASAVLDVSLLTGLLLGAIISSTDAAAVFSVLRARGVGLQGRLRPLLELESGSNDPMAVFLTVALLELVQHEDATIVELLPVFAQQMAVGGLAGVLIGKGAVAGINRLRLEYDGLYPVMSLSVVLLTYGAAAVLGGSGFLAVYLAGLVMGNAQFLHRKSLMRFHDAIAWLMQIAMFLVLGLLVFPSEVGAVAGEGLLIAATLVLVARPVAVVLTLAFTRLGARAVLLVSWVGLRGAVPIILATFPLVEGLPEAGLIFNVVFFAVLTSVLVQGTTISPVARWLKVDAPLEGARPYPLELVPTAGATTDLHDLSIPEGSPVVGRALVELALPEGALIVLVNRGGDFVVPQGSTVLEGGDNVLLLATTKALAAAEEIIGGRAGQG